MSHPPYTLTVDLPETGLLRLVLSDASGTTIASRDVPVEGHVDNALLTGVDNLIKETTIDRSVLTRVVAGAGIDKNSSSYRMVQSFGSALSVASPDLPEKR